MNIERLVAMANDIARYFASEPDHAAGVAGIADHVKRFWEPGMRRQIVAHWRAGGEGLESLAKQGVQRLMEIDPKAAPSSSSSPLRGEDRGEGTHSR